MLQHLLLVSLCILSVLGAQSLYSSDGGQGEGYIKNQKVFILTLPRSGSSFSGEIFLKNPDFMYLFEPLRSFSEAFANDNCAPIPEDPRAIEVTKAVFNCQFGELKDHLASVRHWGHRYWWSRIKDFSGGDKVNRCLPPNSESPEASETPVVVKEINMWAPKLNWLHDTFGNDLYVLWLIRDPRGWVSSWLVPEKHGSTETNFFYQWEYHKKDLWSRYSLCDAILCDTLLDYTLLERIKGILNNNYSEPHLKMAAWWALDTAVTYHYYLKFYGKIMIVKYEDLAKSPFATTNKIYSFLGHSQTNEHVVEWLNKATNGGDVTDRYQTSRKSSEMTNIWQKRLSLEQIKDIEEITGVWFPYFGFKFSHDML